VKLRQNIRDWYNGEENLLLSHHDSVKYFGLPPEATRHWTASAANFIVKEWKSFAGATLSIILAFIAH
jgi:hypothetical protein